MNSKARGTIIKVPDATPGLLFVGGQQKSFTLEGVWRIPSAPATNMIVDVALDDTGVIVAITAVESHQASKEKADYLGAVAQEQGKQAAKLAQQGIGALAARMGSFALATAVLLWIAWFLFPAASIGLMTFSFWGLLGIDFSYLAAPTGNHGMFSIIGLVAIAAPFAAPFIRAAWSRYLNVAPLAFILIGWMEINAAQNKDFAGSDPFSFSWGIYALAIVAAAVAAGALKKPVNT